MRLPIHIAAREPNGLQEAQEEAPILPCNHNNQVILCAFTQRVPEHHLLLLKQQQSGKSCVLSPWLEAFCPAALEAKALPKDELWLMPSCSERSCCVSARLGCSDWQVSERNTGSVYLSSAPSRCSAMMLCASLGRLLPSLLRMRELLCPAER